MIVHPKHVYGSITFSFPQKSKKLVDDVTKTISQKVDWSAANIPGIFDMGTREHHFYKVEDFPPTHHLDWYEHL